LVAVDAELALEEHRVARKMDVGREGREDDAIDLFGGAVGVAQGGERRLLAEIAAGPATVVRDVAARLDAGSRADPFVAGLRLRLGTTDVLVVEEAELGVGHDALGDVAAEAQDLGANHGYRLARPPFGTNRGAVTTVSFRSDDAAPDAVAGQPDLALEAAADVGEGALRGGEAAPRLAVPVGCAALGCEPQVVV